MKMVFARVIFALLLKTGQRENKSLKFSTPFPFVDASPFDRFLP